METTNTSSTTTPITLKDVRRKLFADFGESYGRTKFVYLCQLNNLNPVELHTQAPENLINQTFFNHYKKYNHYGK